MDVSALQWGWEVKTPPRLPDVTVRRKRHLAPGAGRQRRLAPAPHLAASPFESALRAIALDVPGLDLKPQVVFADRLGSWPS